jgi:hypothetical protein
MSEPNPPNKPPISEARRRANKNNAQLSTGPRTERGKNVSKFNNLRSGVYAEELIIPGESAEVLQERRDEWTKDLGALTAPERYEVFNAVHATWRQDRMRRAEAIALTALVEKTEEAFHDQKQQEARELIARLPEAPGEVIQGLRNLTAGLDWMIEQVKILAVCLTAAKGLQASQRLHLIHLCGKRPTDLFIDPEVAEVNWMYLPWAIEENPNPAQAAVHALQDDRPSDVSVLEFEYRIGHAVGFLEPVDEAHAALNQKLDAMYDELSERRELIALREERDLARAIGKAKGDAGPESAQRQRVENAMDRQRRMSLKEFRALQTRPERDDDDPDGTPHESDPGTDPDTAPAAPAPAPDHDGSEPSEPVVSTVTNRSVGTTGSVAVVEALVASVNTPATDTTEASDTPQKWGDEPTCQNGSREEDVGTDTARRRGLFRLREDAARYLLTQASAGPSEATAPGGAAADSSLSSSAERAATALGGAAALTRPSATLSQGERGSDRMDAHFGINGDRSEPAGHDPVAGAEPSRPPPEGGTG